MIYLINWLAKCLVSFSHDCCLLSGSLALEALLIGVHCKKRYINVYIQYKVQTPLDRPFRRAKNGQFKIKRPVYSRFPTSLVLLPIPHFRFISCLPILPLHPLLSSAFLSSALVTSPLHSSYFLSFLLGSPPLVSFPLLSTYLLSYSILSFPQFLLFLLSSPFTSYRIVSYPILFYPILSYPILFEGARWSSGINAANGASGPRFASRILPAV